MSDDYKAMLLRRVDALEKQQYDYNQHVEGELVIMSEKVDKLDSGIEILYERMNDKPASRSQSGESEREANHVGCYERCKAYTDAVDKYNRNVGDIDQLNTANNAAIELKRYLESLSLGEAIKEDG